MDHSQVLPPGPTFSVTFPVSNSIVFGCDITMVGIAIITSPNPLYSIALVNNGNQIGLKILDSKETVIYLWLMNNKPSTK